ARIEYNSPSVGALSISFDRSARVSFGGRRTGTAPLGNRTVRKKTFSSRFPASIFSAHLVNSARNPNTPATTMTILTEPRPKEAGPRKFLGENFNFHLPAPDVVRKILSRDV